MKAELSEEIRFIVENSPMEFERFAEIWESKFPAHKLRLVGMKGDSLVLALVDIREITCK